jgi:ribosome-associated heat shock protein Hsp15
MEGTRVDKWLWTVRIFKTRSLATEACRSGKVKLSGQVVKPSHEVKEGDNIVINLSGFIRTLRVTGFPKNRVSAQLVPDYLTDMTPQEEYEKLKLRKESLTEFRPRGSGRPTKKERRMIDRLKSHKQF